MIPTRSLLSFAVSLLVLSAVASAQCGTEWFREPLAQLSGEVFCMTTWDPDGAGPAPLLLVAGGDFDVASTPYATLATWDGARWTAIASAGVPTAMTVWNGQLVVGSAGQVRTFDGTSWTTIATLGFAGSGTQGEVHAFANYNGALVAAGWFTRVTPPAGSVVSASGVAAWSGAAWQALGSGVAGEARCAAVWNGVLYVGGWFGTSGSLDANLVAWNGSAWSPVGLWNGVVETLALRVGTSLLGTYLFAGGSFTQINGVTNARFVARYSFASNSWSDIGSPGGSAAMFCEALHVRGTGPSSFEVAAAFATPDASQVWRLSGSTWTALGPVHTPDPLHPVGVARCLAYHGGRYVLGLRDAFGAMQGYDAAAARWTPLAGDGFDGPVHAVCADGADVVVGGAFTRVSGVAMPGVARRQAGGWQPLGGGVDGTVRGVARLSAGDVVVGGAFAAAGGQPAANVARWNGVSWQPLGTGIGGTVHAVVALPNGDVLAGGAFATAGGQPAANVARWNGANWQPLGAGTDGTVHALLALPNGDVLAGGAFTTAGGASASRVARWDGAAWSPLGGGVDDVVRAFARTPNGDVWAAGAFSNAGGATARHVARWTGTDWAPSVPLPWDSHSRPVHALASLPNGDLVAGGEFSTFGGEVTLLARLRGGAWQPLGVFGSYVDAVTALPNGEVAVGGLLLLAGPEPAGAFARLASTCPATAVAFGFGCSGSGGAEVLTATSLPWDASTFRSRATGLPALCISIAAFGFLPTALPLAWVLPEALPGCTLVASPDILFAQAASGGVLDTEVFLPSTPSLVGQALYHQVVSFELGAQGQLAAVTATNGLLLTVGQL